MPDDKQDIEPGFYWITLPTDPRFGNLIGQLDILPIQGNAIRVWRLPGFAQARPFAECTILDKERIIFDGRNE